jgi:hypothetical protein
LTVATKMVEKHVLHYRPLYEPLRMKKTTSDEMASVLGLYVNRWQRWVAAGLQGIAIVRCHDKRHIEAIQYINPLLHCKPASHNTTP